MKKKVRGKTKKEKKRLFLISLVIIGLLSFFGYSLYDNFIKISDNKNKIKELSNEYDNLLDEKKELSSEVVKMQDPDYIARYAKEKYLYSSSGEVILRVEDENEGDK